MKSKHIVFEQRDDTAINFRDSVRTDSYQVEIDGLRALAVLAVIINHYSDSVLLIGSNATAKMCKQREWFNKLQCETDIDMQANVLNQYVIFLNEHLSELQSAYPETVGVIDPIRLICSDDKNSCPIENKKVSFFMSDGLHLSGAALDILYPEILRYLKLFKEEK